MISRILAYLLVTTSLGISAAMALLWNCSYGVTYIARQIPISPSTRLDMFSSHGVMVISTYPRSPRDRAHRNAFLGSKGALVVRDHTAVDPSCERFALRRRAGTARGTVFPPPFVMAFAHWLVIVVALPTGLLVPLRKGARRWRRKRGGLCLGCGYDLRASAERCPECGMPSAVLARPSAGTSD